MTSWRGDTAQPVQDVLDRLAGAALVAAQNLLAKNGEFLPGAVTLTSDGGQRLVAADRSLGRHPESQAVLDVLHAGSLEDATRDR